MAKRQASQGPKIASSIHFFPSST